MQLATFNLQLATMNNMTQIIGSYTLLEKIGDGPLTAVYRARHQKTHQIVALKLLPEQIGKHPSVIKKLQTWAIRMKTPPHPGILPLLALETAAGRFYTVYPLLDGGSLRQNMEELQPEEISQLLLRLSDMLITLHRFDTVHQNIKPENVLFDDQGKSYLTDGGLAPIIRPILDLHLAPSGYMSPEQIEGKEVDGRSDFYALGIMLYEMLCGQRPYEADTDAHLLQQQLTQPLPPLTSQNEKINPLYEKLIGRLCHRDIAQRPEDSLEAGDLIVSIIAQVEEWPKSVADYADNLAIFDHIALYHKRELTREEHEARTAQIQALKREEEHASYKRMENFMAIEEERQAKVREQITQQNAQERMLIIISFSILLIVVLGFLGYYLSNILQ